MLIQPRLNYHLAGTSIRLDKTKTYKADHATNQPDWKVKGLIFVYVDEEQKQSMLLELGEYAVKGKGKINE